MKSTLSLLLCFPLCLASHSAFAASAASPPSTLPPEAAQPAAGVVLSDPVAEVEGEKISRAELETTLNRLLASRGKTIADFSDEQKMQGYRAVLNQMILQRLVAKRAADTPVSDAEVAAGFDRIKERFPSEQEMNAQMQKSGETVESIKTGIRSSIQQKKWVAAQIGNKGPVTEADAQSYYDKNPEQFKTHEAQVRASHILISVPKDASPDVVAAKEKVAKAALDRIHKGEDFGKVAMELSDDPGSKATGGDLNFFTKEQMVPEFSEAAFKLKKGEVGGPVKSPFGFHIIKVTDTKEAGATLSFPEVKEKLIAFLDKQKEQNAVETLLNQIREKANVKTYLPASPTAPPVTPLGGASSAP